MSNHPLLQGARGERHLLLGNEAIVRGALEAGLAAKAAIGWNIPSTRRWLWKWPPVPPLAVP